MKNKTRYLTVVYSIDDEELFKEHKKEIYNNHINKNEGWCVVALSNGNEIKRLEMIQDILNTNNNDTWYFALTDAMSMVDI